MFPTSSTIFGSFSCSSLQFIPRKIASHNVPRSHHPFLKLFVWGITSSNAAASRYGHSAVAACALEEPSDGETGGDWNNMKLPNRNGLAYLSLMEESGLRADRNTYWWLLDGCFNSGSLVDAKRVHGKIIKAGFDAETVLCDQLIGIYLAFGDFGDAVSLFDDMPYRSALSWNRIISGFLSTKQIRRALSYFSRMLKEHMESEALDPSVLATLLRAFSGGFVPFHYIQQLHAKIIRYGISADSIVGNPLIDIYNKNGFTNSASLVFEELATRDRISWVAMISGFARNGMEDEALLLYSQMCQSGVVPTSYAFSSVLSACTKAKFFENGKQVHAQAFKWGLWRETFVCNALISMYSRCGSMNSAEQIFRKMCSIDAVTYNTLISAHAQSGNGENALRLFRNMQIWGLKPDSVTTASLLSACASVGAIHQGRQLHSYVVKSGIILDIIIEGSLLDFYVSCADIKTAHEFFMSTRKENIVLWNVMLMGYGRLGNIGDSFDLFCQMREVGIRPNQYTYPSILKTCTLVGALQLGEQIHNLIIKSGFEFNVYVSSVLIDMYSKCGRINVAREILGRLTEKDVVSWTAMIAGYAQHDLFFEALRLFGEMLNHGIQPDNIGLSSALSACAGIQALEQGLQIHAQSFVLGYSKDISVGNALICLYARCGRLKDAYSAFNTVEIPDEVSWNGLISGFTQSGHNEQALNVFSWMNKAGIEANLFTYGSVICASANIADVKQGKQIHAMMVKTAYDTEIEGANVLITLYSKCGNIEDARMEFSLMSEKNEVSWNAMITSYSQHGYGSEALRLFEQMKLDGIMPNHVTFVGVLSACSHVGLVTKGLDYFKSMTMEYGILPKPEHYACVVDILGRAGRLDKAREFINEMPIVPDAMVWRTLLSASRVHKNIETGEFAAYHLLELEPHDSATYVLLSNIYAVAKKWDCRDQVRQMMKDRGVKKEPGRSWIEVKNSIHAFFVGDRLHPMADEIYIFLEDLNNRAKALGYVQDKDSLLHDIEQEQKDPTVYIHSEKIAVAFGLISLSKDMPIRVMKNLRICNDCHNWMKYTSRIAGRSVIVRDANRFHHFDDGDCSCGDYW